MTGAPQPWPSGPPVPADPPAAAPEPGSEHALVVRAQAGDRLAMRDLYEQNVRMVYSFLVRRVGRDVADDLTAEVFTKAFERIGRFEWRGIPVRAWLLRIAFNEVVGRSRRRSSTEVLVDRLDETFGSREGAGGWPLGVDDQEARVVSSLSPGGDVLAALDLLSPRQRAAIELRYLRGLSVGEAAVVLDLNDEAVRALTYRALKALRSNLVA